MSKIRKQHRRPTRVDNPSTGKRLPRIEQLEDRRLLFASHVIAQLDGNLTNAAPVQQVPFALSSNDFNLSGSKTVLGFQVQRTSGALDPAAVQILNSAGNPVAARLVTPNLPANSQSLANARSLVVAELAYGNYTLRVGADQSTRGGFQVNVFLAGDLNGDQSVDLNRDATGVRNLLGAAAGSPNYKIEADANLDGIITSFDYTQARDNLNDTTRIKPISSITLGVVPTPVVLPNGNLATNANSVTIQGITQSLVGVSLETGSDSSFDNGSTTSNVSGNYAFPTVPLQVGANTLRVRAKDGFGQQAFASVGLTFDNQAPVIVLNACLASHISGNPIVTGKVTDNLTGVKTLKLSLDNGPEVSIPVDAEGNFSYATTLALDGSADGQHALSITAIDFVGNVSPATELAWTLDTTPPAQLAFDLAPTSDSAPVGDHRTTFGNVTLTGQTEAGALVVLEQTGATSIANESGQFAFPNVALVLGDNLFSTRAIDAAGNSRRSERVITRDDLNCVFNSNLSGWTIIESGGAGTGKGTVHSGSCSAMLTEGNSFVVSLERQLIVPSTPSAIQFTYSGLNFDRTESASIKDAFEVALTDIDGKSLTFTIGSGRDAFFNVTEGLTAATGAGIAVSGSTVTVGMDPLLAGTVAKIAFRLVNNDHDVTSSVRIDDFRITPNSLPSNIPSGTPSLGNRSTSNTIEFSNLSDVSASVEGVYGRTSFHEASEVLSVEIVARNASEFDIDTPLILTVGRLSNPSIRVLDFDGLTNEGSPYFNLSSLIADGTLSPGESASTKTIRFSNPGKQQFSYELFFLGQLNRAPEITTAANLEALTGRSYTYDLDAIDADGDDLQYSLLAGPSGMVVNPETGIITWAPSSIDLGNHTVIVEVADGRGGSDKQSFVLAAVSLPPNRPPLITSNPVTTAVVSQTLHSDVSNVVLKATVRDFRDSHPDFERGSSGHVTGLVLPSLGVDEKPIFAGPPGTGLITNSDTFNQWYNDVPGVNATTTVELKLTETASGSGLFQFSSNAFFPIDNQLFGNEGRSSNYHFALETKAEFVYRGGEVFSFTGDDDVWVFINDQLVVDLGGVHGTISGNVDLDSLGLTPGNAYDMHLFFAERQTSGSNFTLTTSINFGTAPNYRYPVAAIDPDLDSLSYQLISNPVGMTIDSQNGLILWSPKPDQLGEHQVTVLVEDGRGGIATQHFNVVVQPDPGNHSPIIISDPILVAAADRLYQYDVDAIEADDDAISYSLKAAPLGATIDSKSGIISWTPRENSQGNTQSFTVRVEDGRGGFDEQNFTIQVNAPGIGEIRGRKFNDKDADGRQDTTFLLGDRVLGVSEYDSASGDFLRLLIPSGTGGLNGEAGTVQGPDGNIYVSSSGTNEVLRFTVDGQFIDVFASGGGLVTPQEIQFHSDGYLYVVSRGTNQVLRYDAASGDFIDVFASQGLTDPTYIEFGPDGNLYVVNVFGNKDVVRYDGQTGAFIDVVVAGAATNGTTIMVFDQSGRLFVGRNLPDDLFEVDIQTGQVLNVFRFPDTDFGSTQAGVFGPDGLLYISRHLTADVVRFDPKTGQFEVFIAKHSGIEIPTLMAFVGESGISNWTIYLDANDNGIRDVGERFTKTDQDGNYAFTGLPPGNYTVREEQKPGWFQTFPASVIGDNILINGSFESGPNPGGYLPLWSGSKVIDGWTVTADTIDYIGTTWTSANGARSLDLTGTPGAGAIAQKFATIPGATYAVTFQLAGNPDALPTVKDLEVRAAGESTSFAFDTRGRSTLSMGWERKNWEFVATDSFTTLEFISHTPGLGGPALDDVAVMLVSPGKYHHVVLDQNEIVRNINFGNQFVGAGVGNQSPTFSSILPQTAAERRPSVSAIHAACE